MQELLENEPKPKVLIISQEGNYSENQSSPDTQNGSQIPKQTHGNFNTNGNVAEIANNNPSSCKFSESALSGLFGKTISNRKDRNGVSQIVTTAQSHFTLEETQILLQEIMKNGNILFSNVPGMAKLKVDAWENMAELLHKKLPDIRKRPGIQLKKKWENVQMKTRKKILMKQEGKSIEMDTVDNQVIQIIATFFARKSINFTRDLNINKKSPHTSNLIETTSSSLHENEQINIIPVNPVNNEKITDKINRPSKEICENYTNNLLIHRKRSSHDFEDIYDQSFTRFRPENQENVCDHSMLNSQLNADVNLTQLMASLISKSRFVAFFHSFSQGKCLTDTFMEQLKQEHKIRLQTLHFQEVYWQLNLEALLRKCQMNGISTDF